MKHLLTTVIMVFSLVFGVSRCGKNSGPVTTEVNTDDNKGNLTNQTGSKMKITIGTAVFVATMNDNATGNAFKARLPLTLNMTELNGNEKYFDLPAALPANASNPGTIQNGDLLLYGSNTLVLFYKTFSTSYGYTKIARLDNPSGLATSLGSENATVKFELQ